MAAMFQVDEAELLMRRLAQMLTIKLQEPDISTEVLGSTTRLLLQCGPELARQAGLPPRAMGGFDAAMRAVAEEAASAEAAEALAPMRAAEEPGGEKKTAIALM